MGIEHELDIPDFLRRHKGEKLPPWRAIRQAQEAMPKHPWHLPRSMDTTCWALLAEREAAKERKKQESLAALKQWKLENKR